MATYFTLGLNTGATKYKTWSVSSNQFDKSDVSVNGGAYTSFDLTPFGGSGSVKNEVARLNITRLYSILNQATWTLNFDYEITSVNILVKTSSSSSAPTYRYDDWATVENNTVTIKTNLPQDYGSYYLLVLINNPLGITKYKYIEDLNHITSSGSKAEYDPNEEFSIDYDADEGYTIGSLTSNIGTITYNMKKTSAHLAGVATEDITVTGRGLAETVNATYDLSNITTLGKSSYIKNSNVTIEFTPYSGYEITSLTSTLGTVTINDDKLGAKLELVASDDFTVKGIAHASYGIVTISGSFTNCTCNYSDGERITSSKGNVTITANEGYVFKGYFTYKSGPITHDFLVSEDGKRLYTTSTAGIELNDNYIAVREGKSIGGFTNLYKTSNAELKSLSKVRFYNDVDYGNYILQLYVLPYSLSEEIIGDTTTIILGNYDSNVETTELLDYTLHIDYGDIEVPNNYNNVYDFLDTSCILRIPFFDSIPIENQYVIGQTLHIDYVIDLYSGVCAVNITSTFTNNVIMSITTNIVTQIPFVQVTTDNVINQLSTNLLNPVSDCTLEVTHNVSYNPTDNLFGKPTKIVDILSNYSGYVEVDNIELTTNATNDEIDSIKKLLKSGVFIN